MPAEIIKTYKQNLPALRFIGKKYGNMDRVNGNFGKHWDDWFRNGWFGDLEKLAGKNIKSVYEDGDAYVGLMRDKHGSLFEYWIGIFMPPETAVPEGFAYIDFPETTWGVCWVYGKESEVFQNEEKCSLKLEKEGCRLKPDKDGMIWCMERYGCPRFTTPDKDGKVILDICIRIE